MRVLLTAPMTNRQVFEPVDRTLRNIKGEEYRRFCADFAGSREGTCRHSTKVFHLGKAEERKSYPYSLMQCASPMAIRFNTPWPWIVSRFCLKFSV
jgi:hypothetical protein